MSSERISPRSHLHAALLLAACVFFAYGNTLHNNFQYDDDHSLVENPHIRKVGNIPQFFVEPQMFSRNVGSDMYRPLVLVSYALNHALGAYQVEGYHLVNILLHLGTAYLLFVVLFVLGAPQKIALAGALLFAVHPLTSEPVNYISSRSESLVALFMLASFLFYVRSQRVVSLPALLCFGAALMSKEIAVVLVALLLLYETVWRRSQWAHFWRRQLSFWVVVLLYFWGTSALVREAVIDQPVRGWGTQLSTQLKALVYYAKLLLLPQPLSVEHQFFVADSWFDAPVVAAAALVLSALWVVVRMTGPRAREIQFWLGWMALIMAPTFIVPLNVLVNEHRLYLVLVGFIGLLLWLCRNVQWPSTVRTTASLSLFCLLLLTVQRNRVWATEESLWRDAGYRAPLMARPHLRLGIVHRQAGRNEAAAAAYQKALELEPDSAPAHNNMGNLYTQVGNYAAAERAFKKALEILPSYPQALMNLATLYGNYLKRPQEALPLYERALLLSGARGEIYNNLGIAYLNLSRFVEAEAALRKALEYHPRRAGIYFNLGGALAEQDKDEQAVRAFEETIRLSNKHAKAHYKLALLHLQAGRATAAEEALDNVVRWAGDGLLREDARRRLEQLQRSDFDGVNR